MLKFNQLVYLFFYPITGMIGLIIFLLWACNYLRNNINKQFARGATSIVVLFWFAYANAKSLNPDITSPEEQLPNNTTQNTAVLEGKYTYIIILVLPPLTVCFYHMCLPICIFRRKNQKRNKFTYDRSIECSIKLHFFFHRVLTITMNCPCVLLPRKKMINFCK